MSCRHFLDQPSVPPSFAGGGWWPRGQRGGLHLRGGADAEEQAERAQDGSQPLHHRICHLWGVLLGFHSPFRDCGTVFSLNSHRLFKLAYECFRCFFYHISSDAQIQTCNIFLSNYKNKFGLVNIPFDANTNVYSVCPQVPKEVRTEYKNLPQWSTCLQVTCFPSLIINFLMSSLFILE